MKNLWIFMQKEFYENFKNYKILIIFVVMLILNIFGVVMSKYMYLVIPSEYLNNPEFMGLIPEPSYLDGHIQFFKNLSQIIIIMVIIMFGGSVVNEIKKQTAQIMFTKNLKRTYFILAKYFSQIIMVTAVYIIVALITNLFTFLLNGGGDTNQLFLAYLCGLIFIYFFLALCMFLNTIFKEYPIVLGIAIGFLFLCYILSIIPNLTYHLPTSLVSANLELIIGTIGVSKILFSLIFTSTLTIVFMVLSLIFIQKKEVN